MKTATINKPNSNSHGKKVFVHHSRGYRYSCSFTEKGDVYFFNKSDLIFDEKPKKVNQLITGLPSNLKGKKFRIKEFIHGQIDRKHVERFEDFENLEYYSQHGDYHLFLCRGERKLVLICEIV